MKRKKKNCLWAGKIVQPILLIMAVLSGCFAAEASAKVLLVPDEYSTIGKAIAAAQPNDTVRVAAGEYFETVSLTKGITLEGGWDQNFKWRDYWKNTTAINGAKGMGPVVFGADDALIDGFTIKGGKPPVIMPEALL